MIKVVEDDLSEILIKKYMCKVACIFKLCPNLSVIPLKYKHLNGSVELFTIYGIFLCIYRSVLLEG